VTGLTIRQLILGLAFAGISLGISLGTAAAQDAQKLEKDPDVLNFGIISTESSENLRDQWEPFLKEMELATGLRVKPFFSTDYAGIIEAMRFAKVHVAWMGNKAAIEAVDRANAEVFAKLTRKDGSDGYFSYIITNADNSNANSLSDMFKQCGTGLNFGIGDPNSTSGNLVPSYYVFAQNKIDPRSCFKTVRAGSHEANFAAVANKLVDYATNNSEELNRVKANDPALAKKVKVIWTSPAIANDPILYRKDLSPDLKDKIHAFFLSFGRIGTPSEIAKAREILAKMNDGYGPFTDSDNTQLYETRELNLFTKKLAVQYDGGLSNSDKSTKLAELDKQLDTLKLLETQAR
jgi:phosphonate transport system substrate-binding protein